MHDLLPALAVLVRRAPFEHLATAWSVAPGEWVTAWDGDPEDAPDLSGLLLIPADGPALAISDWEHDAGIAGFRTAAPAPLTLPSADGAELHKRTPLRALGFPSVIDHPAFRLHRGSLDAARYAPYLCPWTITGHLALFDSHDGWLTGRCYPGMAGAPVVTGDGRVVGVLTGGEPSPDHPPLARFRRLA